MENKIVSEYEYQGLGFPIILKNVEFLKIHEQWHPKINVEKVAEEAFYSLIKKSTVSPLTGNEIEFIRVYLNMNKKEFGDKLNVDRTTISRWEKSGDKATITGKNDRQAILETFAPAI